MLEPDKHPINTTSSTDYMAEPMTTPTEGKDEGETDNPTAKQEVLGDNETELEVIETEDDSQNVPTPAPTEHSPREMGKVVKTNKLIQVEKAKDGPHEVEEKTNHVPDGENLKSSLDKVDDEIQDTSLTTSRHQKATPVEKEEENKTKEVSTEPAEVEMLGDKARQADEETTETKRDSEQGLKITPTQSEIQKEEGAISTMDDASAKVPKGETECNDDLMEMDASTPLLDKTVTGSATSKDIEERRLVAIVIGATGAGKSATANTLLGHRLRQEDRFKESSGAVSVETSVKEQTIKLDDMDFSSSILYPNLSQEQLETLESVDSTEEQLQKANDKAKGEIEKRLKGYGHTILNNQDKYSSKYTSLTVIDTPGSWNLKGIGTGRNSDVIYIIVINLASPRFLKEELATLRSLKGWGHGNVVGSDKALVILTHAESALGAGKSKTNLEDYLKEIEDDPLHTFLTEDMGSGKYLAANNGSMSEYETNAQRQSLLLKMYRYSGRPNQDIEVSVDSSDECCCIIL